MPERSSSSLQPLADLAELLRSGVDALLLNIRTLLLSLGPQAQSFQLRLHLLHRPGELCQLGCNARYVLLCGRGGLSLRGRSAAHCLIATASISISTSSRKSPLTSTRVLAGGCSVSTYSSRIARTEAISRTSRKKY